LGSYPTNRHTNKHGPQQYPAESGGGKEWRKSRSTKKIYQKRTENEVGDVQNHIQLHDQNSLLNTNRSRACQHVQHATNPARLYSTFLNLQAKRHRFAAELTWRNSSTTRQRTHRKTTNYTHIQLIISPLTVTPTAYAPKLIHNIFAACVSKCITGAQTQQLVVWREAALCLCAVHNKPVWQAGKPAIGTHKHDCSSSSSSSSWIELSSTASAASHTNLTSLALLVTL